MSDKYAEHMKRIRTARMQLLAKHPFFGDLAFGLPIKWDENLNPPTAATNGVDIIFHPGFVEKLPMDELVFVLAHEVMHPALLHILRFGNRDLKRWNVACDIVVNYLLAQAGIGKMPSFGIYEPSLYLAGQGKVEKIYDLLPKQPEDYNEPGEGNGNGKYGSMDAMLEPSADKQEEMAANWRNKLHQALQTAKKAGNVPGGIEAFVEEMTKPKVSWREKLRSFIMTTRGTDRTWAKRNRRYASMDLSLPGNYGEKMGEIAVFIDCSGSTDDEMIAQCGQEIASIQEELRPEKVHVMYFDTDVKKHEEYEPDEPLTIKAYGRGGTCFRTCFEYLDANGINPESCIVMTDLCCDDFGPKPDYPVMWCVLQGNLDQAPWGEVLVVE